MDDEPLHIPSGSFTAYRLAYCSSSELSRLARTVLVGPIPDIYANEKSSNIVARAVSRSKQSVQKNLRGVGGVIHRSVAASASRMHLERSPLFLGHGRLDPETVLHELEDRLDMSSVSSSSKSFPPEPAHGSLTVSPSTTPREENPKIPLFLPEPDAYPPLAQSWSVDTSPETLPVPKQRRQRISIAEPTPAALDRSEFSRVEEQHKRFREKFKRLALVSKGRAKQTGTDLRSAVFRRLMSKYRAGEVVRVDKMLVLVKVAATKMNAAFTENEPCDSRVAERWRELHVVLRRTDDVTKPLVVQLYEISLFDEATTTSKPETTIPLSSLVTALFYSRLDKTISLWVDGEKPMVYIFACKDHVTAVTWLYFVGQFVSDNWDPAFQISIPDLGIALVVMLTDVALLKLAKKPDEMEVKELAKGYRVQKNPLFEHLNKAIVSSLGNEPDLASQFRSWQEENPNPWFCHKLYDRLEWATDSGGLLAMEHQLLKRSYVLEYRQASHLAPICTNKAGQILHEPPPVEGFLSRISSVSGHGYSLYRTFNRALYFYSHRGLLFYTKYYRGTPSTVSNRQFHDRNGSSIAVEHNPFPLDANEHISWLHEDFAEHDSEAQRDFERRVLQVIKAEGVVDMARVQSIQTMPFEQIRRTHKVLLASLWYSNPSLATVREIVDSCFTIEMDTGEQIRLQAPSRDSRDEWVDRLRATAEYWSAKNDEILFRLKDQSRKNRACHKIGEYIDSNATEEMDCGELHNSFADPQLHNIEPLAMTHCVSMYGHLFLKTKMHANFRPYFVVLCPGYLVMFKTYRRSKLSGASKKSGYYRHFVTLPISECYLYLGTTCSRDLVDRKNNIDSLNPGSNSLPRVYPDGWKSSEEQPLRCFTLTVGEKRAILKHRTKDLEENLNNPGMLKLAIKLGVTGHSLVFMARSRQEREIWVQRIFSEIDRFAL